MKTYALDFESYYDKNCSITTLGPRGYFSHPDFDAYMVSVVGDDGYEFCGNPRDFDWSMLTGHVVLSHNASFDESLFIFGVEKGWWPTCQPAEWHCTADMVAYCGLPRSLKNALAAVFDIDMSKGTRDSMAGKQWCDMTPEFQKEVTEYAIKDSVLCLQLWQELEHKWPVMERRISAVNRRALQRGLPIDQDYLKECLEEVRVRLHEAEQRVPWIGTSKLLSRPAFDAECRKVGIEPPKSLALDNDEANEWIRVHGIKYAWVAAIRDYRRINSLKKKLEAFDYATMSDGRYYGGLMYFGAPATGRFSGSGGNLNLQNLPRDENYGVNLRKLVRAKKGKKLVVVDLSQIEVRTLCWLAGDTDTLKLIEEHDDIYEAFAIKYNVWTPEQGSLKDNGGSLRSKLVKPTTLGCGYQAGAQRLSEQTDMDLETAEHAVKTYRSTMKPVVGYWKHLQTTLMNCYTQVKPLAIALPSGRVQNYGPIKMRRVVRTETSVDGEGVSHVSTRLRNEFFATLLKNGRQVPSKLYGGLLTENLSQALARDIFAEGLVKIEDAGYPVLFHVHDEVVVEVDEPVAEQALADIIGIFAEPPKWIPDIPLASEGHVMDVYEKK